MSVYLVRSLLLSFFISVFIAVCFYFLGKEVKSSQLGKSKPAKTFTADFTVKAYRTDFTLQDQAFAQAVEQNWQTTAARLEAARFEYKLVSKSDSTYSISIPRVTDTNGVRDLLTSNGALAFYEMYTLTDLLTAIMLVDKNFEPVMKKNFPDSLWENNEKDTSATRGLFSVLLPASPYEEPSGRVIYHAHIGSCKKKDTALVRAFFNDEEILSKFPPDIKFLFGDTDAPPEVIFLYAVRRTPDLSNKSIQEAFPEYDDLDEPYVAFRFNAAGAIKWAKMTERNIGKPIAICINEKVITAPNVIQKIVGGECRLTIPGNIEACRIMSVLLTRGELLLPVKIVESRITKGKESLFAVSSPLWKYFLVFLASFAISFCLIWFVFRPGKKG